ncbi:MAG: bacteriohopanetetrol glucosamine biosynthesis glycosyltransferase HpnI [Candidatus Velthaea sp.]
MLRKAAFGATALAACVASGYTAFATLRALNFAARRRQAPLEQPSIAALRPLHGAEPRLAEHLHALCAQDYGPFTASFCVRSLDDEALPIAQAVVAEWPGIAQVAIGDDRARRNPKVRTLAGCEREARGEIVVVADADIGVERSYLQAIAAAFDDPAVGAVTALYRGEPLGGLVAELGAMGIEEQFAPSVLVAGAIEPLRYCFGATMAVRHDLLEAIGGFAALDELADDHALGRLVSERGRRIVLADTIVTTTVAETTLGALWDHEVRWARTTRALRPGSYLGLCVGYPISFALLALVLARRRLPALGLVAMALGMRFALHAAARRALGVDRPSRWWLVPARDLFGLTVWVAGIRGRTVRWRDVLVELDPR